MCTRNLPIVSVICLTALLMLARAAAAQQTEPKTKRVAATDQRQGDQAEDQAAAEDERADEPVPYARDFSRPYDDRPWRRPRYLDPPRRYYHDSQYDHRTRRNRSWHRRYRADGRWDAYWGDTYGSRYGHYTLADLDEAYRQGFDDGRDYERFEIQAERGFLSFTEAMEQGLSAFASGRYVLAAKQYQLAARLNQRDPSSRLSAGLAQMAVGEYESAARLIRRALQLQPKLVYMPIDVRQAYDKHVDDFVAHMDALTAAVEADTENAELWFLLGYFRYFSNDAVAAHEAWSNARRLAPEDGQIAILDDLARAARSTQEKPRHRANRR